MPILCILFICGSERRIFFWGWSTDGEDEEDWVGGIAEDGRICRGAVLSVERKH
jgi:hypothetical protein